MESELRQLVGRYGFKSVKECLDEEMKTTYQYLHHYFHSKNKTHTPGEKEKENIVINQIQDVILTTDIPQNIHIEKDVPGPTEKTVSLANSTTVPKNSVKVKNTPKMALTKVPEPTPPPNPEPTPETKPKRKYFHKKKV